MTSKSKLLIGVAALAIAGGVTARTFLVPDVDVNLIQAAKSPAANFDHTHASLDEILKSSVKAELVDYAGLKKSPAKLNAYLGELAAVKEADFKNWNEDQQLAMLINLYNAATLKLIIDHYPVKSIKNIGGLFKKPWDIKSLMLFGKEITLDHLEHEILRKDYTEPRIHFAIVCAAKGCPALRPGAFTAKNLDAQLKEQGQKFLQDSAKNRVDAANNTVHISKIFEWFEEDFTKKGTVIDFARPYFSAADQKALQNSFTIKYTDYDWSLNKQ